MLSTRRPVPQEYFILPERRELRVPGFDIWNAKADLTTLLAGADPVPAVFASFRERVLSARERHVYLPILRMSDGEYKFLLGDQSPSRRLPLRSRVSQRARTALRKVRAGRGFTASTLPGVSSGRYSKADVDLGQPHSAQGVRHVAQHGILGLHLTFGEMPFQEHYHPPLLRFLNAAGITLTTSNYVPFYLVYALLAAHEGRPLIRGQRLLLVNGATGAKKEAIETRLLKLGAASVAWCSISASRSLLDCPSVEHWAGAVDLAFIGAGIGKLPLYPLLAPLSVPCIDAGFMFEVWADPSKAALRAYCYDDHSWTIAVEGAP